MEPKRVLSAVRQALRGEHHDYTEGALGEALFLLAVPMILELGLESVFAVVDMFFVSRLGQNAIATVGMTESVITIVYSIAIGLSTGATAIVARRIGEKKPEEAAHAGAQAILVSIAVSVVLGALGAIFAPDILGAMGATSEVVAEGSVFTRILLAANAPILLLFLVNGIFRGAGNAAMAMRSLWMASGVNIVLCPILIHVFGLKGAAIATVVGRTAGVLYQIVHLRRGDGELKFRAAHFKFDPAVMRGIVSIAWPASFQFLIGSGSWIVLTRLVAETGGMAASAGFQIAMRNFVFFILPAWGLSNAAATLVGQNLGAKRVDRAERSVFVTAKVSAALMFLVTVLFVFGAGPIIRVFAPDGAVAEHGMRGLRIIGAGFVFYGVGMVMTQALNGAGATRTPTWINLVCFWIFQLPLGYGLAKGLGYGGEGAIAAVPISHALLACLATYYFRRGKWKSVRV